jgi:hypothetical protein
VKPFIHVHIVSSEFCKIAHIYSLYSFIVIVDVSSSDTYDEGQEKRDDARSISRRNTVILDWFWPSHRVIALRPVCAVLCCEI